MADLHVGVKDGGRSWSRFLTLLFVVTIFHFLLAGFLPLAEDEIYYWAWSRNLAPSYFDHPPIIAWAIRVSTTLFGNSAFGVRLPAVLFATSTVFIMGALSPQVTLTSLVLFTPLFFLGSVLMTPDLPLVFFWALYLFWTTRIQARLESWNSDPVTRVYHNSPISPMDWLWGGIILGLGLLSKYTMLMAVACSFATFFTRTIARAWWKGFILHLIVAGLLGLPVLVFNHQYDFLPLKFQWAHISQGGAFTWARFFNFWGGQGLLVSFLPMLFLPRILLCWRYLWTDPRLQPCLVFFLLPGTYFFYKSLTANLEGNWGIVIYVAFWPLAQRICQISSFKTWSNGMIALGFLPAWIATIGLAVHVFYPLKWIAPYKDRFRVSRSRIEVSEVAAAEIKAGNLLPLYVPGYQWTSIFRYQGIDAEQLAADRMSQFSLRPSTPCNQQTVYFWHRAGVEIPVEIRCFATATAVKNYVIMVSGVPVETLELVKLEK